MRENVLARLDELEIPRTIPIQLYSDESIEKFQKTMREMFLGGEDRILTKRYLKLFIEKIVINLPNVEITGKTGAVLALLKNNNAARTDGVLTADDFWLPG